VATVDASSGLRGRRVILAREHARKAGGSNGSVEDVAMTRIVPCHATSARLHDLFATSPTQARGDEAPNEARFWSDVESVLARTEVVAGSDPTMLMETFTPVEIPPEPVSVGQYLTQYTSKIVHHSINVGSPRCLGHMTGAPPEFVQLLAAGVVALNQNLVKLEASRAATLVERQTLAMMHRLTFGLDDGFYREHVHAGSSTLGVFSSGGTLSNLTALWCARNACLPPVEGSPGAEQEGPGPALRRDGFRSGVMLASSLAHYSLEKATGMLGLGARGTIKVPVDRLGRMDVGELERILERCREGRQRVIAVVGTAGTTECGSIDPLEAIARLAHQEEVHFHVDAAW
jgi:glutamate decarboxylase